MTIVCISDTHGHHKRIAVSDADMIIHAGDFTMHGREHEVVQFRDWFMALPHKHKIVIPGNHDWFAEQQSKACAKLFTGIHYAIHDNIEIAGIKIGMFAFQPRFFDWAFNIDRNSDRMQFLWDTIDNDCDIIVSHGPPFGYLDMTPRGERVGCEIMKAKINKCSKLKLIVCGHIHEGYGECIERTSGVRIVNASSCDGKYRPVNKPIIAQV